MNKMSEEDFDKHFPQECIVDENIVNVRKYRAEKLRMSVGVCACNGIRNCGEFTTCKNVRHYVQLAM